MPTHPGGGVRAPTGQGDGGGGHGARPATYDRRRVGALSWPAVIHSDPLEASLANRARHLARNVAGGLVRFAWDHAADVGSIGHHSPRAREFGAFGELTVICFPYAPHVNPRHIHLGAHTMVAPYVTLSAGWGPGQPNLPDVVVGIGDRCLIGRGSSLIGHRSIVLEDDVWTGYDVRIGDMNHNYEDLSKPISVQAMPMQPVRIGAGSWLGHHVVVLPGVTIGRHVTVGAGSVVSEDLPDYSVAVGTPARVVRQWDPDQGWHRPSVLGAGWEQEVDRTLSRRPSAGDPA